MDALGFFRIAVRDPQAVFICTAWFFIASRLSLDSQHCAEDSFHILLYVWSSPKSLSVTMYKSAAECTNYEDKQIVT